MTGIERLVALLWIEENGGLDEVKNAVKVSGDYRDALNGVCKLLALTDGDGLPEMPEVILTELERRLMPEGMEMDGNVLRIRTAENVDYDGETLFVLIGGCDE